MLSIGSTELILILVVALIVVGPQNLPKITHAMGRAFGEFKRASRELQRTLNTEIAIEEQKQAEAAKRTEHRTNDADPETEKS